MSDGKHGELDCLSVDVWIANTGPIRICDMTDDHLRNVMNFYNKIGVSTKKQSPLLARLGRIEEEWYKRKEWNNRKGYSKPADPPTAPPAPRPKGL